MHSGIEYQNKTQKIGDGAEAGRGNPVKSIRVIRAFLKKLGAEAEDHSTALQGPSQTMQNADELDAHAHSWKHLESNVPRAARLGKVYDMAVRVAQSDTLRHLEDFIVTLERVALAGQWKVEQKRPWEDLGTTMCLEPLRAVAQVPGQAQEVNVAETQLNILKSRRDKLLSIAQSMEEETGDKSEKELIDMKDNML
jgi:hypothetical protein